MVDIAQKIFELAEEAEEMTFQGRHCEASHLYETMEYLKAYEKVCGIKEILDNALRTYKYHKSIAMGNFAKEKNEKKVSETLDELNKINNAISIINKL